VKYTEKILTVAFFNIYISIIGIIYQISCKCTKNILNLEKFEVRFVRDIELKIDNSQTKPFVYIFNPHYITYVTESNLNFVWLILSKNCLVWEEHIEYVFGG